MAIPTPNGLLKYWPMVLSVFALAIALGSNMADLVHAEEDITQHEERIQSIEKNLGDINTSIATALIVQEFTADDLRDIKLLISALVNELAED